MSIMNTTFSITEVYKTAWDYTKKNMVFLLVSTFVFFVLSVILTEVSKDGGVFGILGIASIFLYTIFHIGLVNIGVLISKGGSPDMDNFKTDWLTFWRLILATIITVIFVAIGSVLFIIPGIILAVRLSLTSFLVIDRQYSFWPAIKESYRVTKGHSWNIFGLFLLSFLVAMIAAIPYGLGFILATPFFGMVYIVMSQRVLSMKKQEVSKEVTPAPVVSDEDSQMPLIVDKEVEIETEVEKEEIIKGVKEMGEKYKISDKPEVSKKPENIEKKEEVKTKIEEKVSEKPEEIFGEDLSEEEEEDTKGF